MHLLEAMLSAFRHTKDDAWLTKAIAIKDLFFARLLNSAKTVIFEFRNSDWSVADYGRIEIGHQLEWPTLLLELHEITGEPKLAETAECLLEFAKQYGFENGLAINVVQMDGTPVDRAKLLWVQTEAARRGLVSLDLIRQKFFHPNGWTWYNRLTPEDAPVEEPANARLLYHVLTAASGT
jgi:mannose-6-phosphate isomerase